MDNRNKGSKGSKGYKADRADKKEGQRRSFNKFDEIRENSQLEGRNSVLEALNHGRTIDKIFIKKGEVEGTLKVIAAKAREAGIPVQEVDKAKLLNMQTTASCQGVIALTPAKEYCTVYDILDNAKSKGEEPFVIILDEIEDPHNLGAIIRSAETAGAHGVIIPKNRSASLTATASKASAGALEYMPVAKVTNICRTIDELKKQGLWITCADMKGTTYYNANLKGAVGLVIGSEGTGVGRLVKERCDFTVRIPMYGNIKSLNASVAAGLVMYEVVRQRKFV
ncbi:MAG: 23S rRNA (guanosine(2251)-2'-O)-methyltransferase RlmB [Clostridiales bacterium]|nr:23S rRNA (guanosine(2251)-2'-O)-methyltransferase RlmB [Clostridiales bacterium]